MIINIKNRNLIHL